MFEIELSQEEKNRLFAHPYSGMVFKWIEENYESKGWELIWYGGGQDENFLSGFLSSMAMYGMFDVTLDDWYKFVTLKKEIITSGKPTVVTINPRKPLVSEPGKYSAWQDYKKKLEDKKFTPSAIDKIALASRKVVTELSSSTEQNDPIRGMVVGNVQSGKTANMAGVIAMAADYGYNMFIVLSGTIENLRVQTQKRLLSDLSSGAGSYNFKLLDNVSATSPAPYRLQDLFLDEGDKDRYLMVCLKNSSRLRDLLKWICKFPQNKEKLKILVIDDEADQAGINTADYSKDLKTTICRLIENLVFARDYKNNDDNPYKCMNYIGYTATPYANFLNTSSLDSLYPRSFILTLSTSNEYFGPKEIFGVADDESTNGLSIINPISDEEKDAIKNIESMDITPEGLINAIIWFLCTVVLFRKWKLKSPVSMLIHTSQRQSDHESMQGLVKNIFNEFVKYDKNNLIKLIHKVWDEQTEMFNKDILFEEYPDYEVDPAIVNDFPEFDDIIDDILELINKKINYIKLDDESETLVYSDGIHLCVDNCYNNSIEDGNHLRIVYPDSESQREERELCPAFIIIGGSTLARGLTLEGLTVSYFLRGANQADTLMQMGRWFGYRRKYEVLPRIWMHDKTVFQFEYLAKLDEDLREELRKMQTLNQKPSEYAARIDKFPAFVYLKITSQKKMQNAIIADFSNHRGQTTHIYSDDETIIDNYKKTIGFVNSLGSPDNDKLSSNNNPLLNEYSRIWINVDYKKVLDYLKSMAFPKQSSIIQDYDSMECWFKEQFDKKVVENWHIVLSGVQDGYKIAKVSFDKFNLYLGQRSKIKSKDSSIINLKTITRQSDHFIDINCVGLNKDDYDNVTKYYKDYQLVRSKVGLEKTPLLIIYIIDKDSVPTKGKTRFPLNTVEHIVGYDIYIPSDNKEEYGTKVSVKLEKYMEEEE